MAAKSKKPVEYRDTFEFRIFPGLIYTNAQKMRLRLFQGRVEHWKAAVNYADRFKDPQNINLLYLIGYTQKLKPYLEQHTTTNLVVLCVPFTSEDLKVYDRFWDMVKKYLAAGLCDKDGTFTQYFYEAGQRNIQYRDTDDTAERMAQEYESESMLIESYRGLEERGMKYFDHMILVDKLHKERTVSFSDLDKIVKSYFPYGREHIGANDRTIRFPKKILDALQSGLNRENAARIFGFSADTDTYTLCKKEIRRCEMDISVPLRKTGTVDLASVFRRMQNPPYGWDNDVHSAYCFGCAVSGFLEDAWIWDEVSTFRAKEAAQAVLRGILRGDMGRRSSFVLITADSRRLCSRFAYLFNMGQASPKDETDKRILELRDLGLSERKIAEQLGTMSNVAVHKRLSKMKTERQSDMPFCGMATLICKQIEGMTRWPVSLVDSRLQKTVCGTWDAERHLSVPVFEKAGIKDALSYFTEERCREIKSKLEQINTYIPELIRHKYGDDVDIDDVYQNCTTACSGWLWDSDLFWDGVDRHINHIGMHRREDGWYFNDVKQEDFK